MNASSLSGLWAMVIFMGSGRKAHHSPTQDAEVLEGQGAQDERGARPLPGGEPLPEEREGEDEGGRSPRASSGPRRVWADEGHAGQERGHGHDGRDDADAGHAQEADGVEREAEPSVREGEGHAENRRRLREMERQHAGGDALPEAAAQHDVGGVDERGGEGPGDAGRGGGAPAAAPPAVSAQPAKARGRRGARATSGARCDEGGEERHDHGVGVEDEAVTDAGICSRARK